MALIADMSMLMLSQIFRSTVPTLYGAGALFYLFYFYKKNNGLKRFATLTLTTSAVVHFGYTVALGILAGRHPMATIFEFLSFVAMTMTFIYLFMEIWQRNAYIGAFVVPAIFFLQLCSALGSDPGATLTPLLREVRYALHATAFAAAYAAFFLGVLFAVMVILFERSVRRHHFGIVFEQLPPLNVLAKMTANILLLGFVLMSVGLGIGVWNALQVSNAAGFDAKIIFTILVWLLYGLAVLSRFVLRWSEKATALLSIAGFVLLVLTTLLSHVTVASWHHFIG